MRRISALILVVSLLLAGCGGGGGGSTQSPIVGRWRQVQVGNSATIVNCPGSVPYADGSPNGCGPDDQFEFRANGTWSAVFMGSPFSGTYTLNGNALIVTTNGSDLVTVVEFNGNAMTVRYTEDGIQFRETYNKL